jgi:hypothetical protein
MTRPSRSADPVLAGHHRVAVRSSIRAAAAREPGLVVVGSAGLVLAGVCLVGVGVRGRFVPPEGKMLDAATFCFGVGVFTLTVALLLPLAGYGPPARRRWRRAFYVFAVYGLALESLQAFRGVDPRFTEEGRPVDVVAGIVFGVTALSNTLLFVLLALRFFRSDVLADRPLLRDSIRYGAAAVALSFAIGIMMSVNSGRVIGDDGNLLVSHGLGVHGIQAVPIVAVLMSATMARQPRPWIHIAGIGWLLACTAALVQALLGEPPFEASFVSAVIIAALASWTGTVGYSLVAWFRSDPRGSLALGAQR